MGDNSTYRVNRVEYAVVRMVAMMNITITIIFLVLISIVADSMIRSLE